MRQHRGLGLSLLRWQPLPETMVTQFSDTDMRHRTTCVKCKYNRERSMGWDRSDVMLKYKKCSPSSFVVTNRNNINAQFSSHDVEHIDYWTKLPTFWIRHFECGLLIHIRNMFTRNGPIDKRSPLVSVMVWCVSCSYMNQWWSNSPTNLYVTGTKCVKCKYRSEHGG